MGAKLTTAAEDRDTYAVDVTFTDENGDAMTPNWIKWTLSNQLGGVVNDRMDVAVATPSTSITITLYGDDLRHEDGDVRLLRVFGEFDSSLGNDLPFNRQVEFDINDVANDD